MPELVKPGYKLASRVIVGRTDTCSNCGATVRFTKADADNATFSSDQRDGDAWVIKWLCPDHECGHSNSTYISVPGRDPGGAEAYYER